MTVCPFADNCVGVPYITSRLVRKHTCVKGIMMYDKRGAVDFFVYSADEAEVTVLYALMNSYRVNNWKDFR
jgi:hypothetical protein